MVLLVIFFIINISIGGPFIYFYWYFKRSNTKTNVNTSVNTETLIY